MIQSEDWGHVCISKIDLIVYNETAPSTRATPDKQGYYFP